MKTKKKNVEIDTINPEEKLGDNIIEWGVINLMDDVLENHVKCIANKKGAKCGKIATHCLKNDNSIAYCNNKNCQSFMKAVYLEKDIKKIKKLTTKSLSLQDMAINLVKQLNEKPELLDVDEVVIENQPVLKNPTMKSIQMLIFSYFIINGIDKGNRVSNINLFSAKNKLQVYDGPEIECDKKGEYAKRKFLSTEYTKWFLRDNDKWLNYFTKNKKKDDLGDCYLQAKTFVMKNKKDKGKKILSFDVGIKNLAYCVIEVV